jgi:Caspase domain
LRKTCRERQGCGANRNIDASSCGLGAGYRELMKYRDISSDPAPAKDTVAEGRKVVAVVGIDRYRAWPALNNAVSDARGALRVFQHLGFEQIVPPLIDETATGDAIRRLVTDDLAALGRDDSLVLFFAGHGHTQTRTLQSGPVQTGFLVPIDGDRPDGRVATWLRLDTWLSDVARLPARHILVILDACHSGIVLGSLIKWRGAGDPMQRDSLDALRRRQSRRVITSALGDQRAMDGGPIAGHSLFTGCLIEGLTGGLARDGHREATGSEIGVYVQQRVTGYSTSMQTPDFGTLELDHRGELVVPIATADQSSLWLPQPISDAKDLACPRCGRTINHRALGCQHCSSQRTTASPADRPPPAVTPEPEVSAPNPIILATLKFMCFPISVLAPRLISELAKWLTVRNRWVGALGFMLASTLLAQCTSASRASAVAWLVVSLGVVAAIVVGRAVSTAPAVVRSTSAAMLRRKGWVITVLASVVFGLCMGAAARAGRDQICSEKLAAAYARQQANLAASAALWEAAQACQAIDRDDDAQRAIEAARIQAEREAADRRTAEREAADRKAAERKASFDRAVADAEHQPETAEGAAAAVSCYMRALEFGALDETQAAQFAIRLRARGKALMAQKDYAAAASAFEQAKLQDPGIAVDAALAAARAAQRERDKRGVGSSN